MSARSTAVRASLLASLALAAVATSAVGNPPAQLKPNLKASSTARGYYTITNIGTAPAAAFKVKVTFEYGGAHWVDSVGGLDAGQSVTILAGRSCEAGYTVEADSSHTVAEISEVDNTVHVDPMTTCA
jgi:hypothetical protein